MEKLVDIQTGKLLEKFGLGSHIPGSGSASALQGMLSAKMLLTVVNLTDDEKRRENYTDYLPQLIAIKYEVESRIYNRLEHLLQTDSDLFDDVIKLRTRRDEEKDTSKQSQFSKAAQESLKPATQIPLEIAELCLELGDFAAYVFDYGWKSVRGDSGVALSSAIAGVASCLFIIDLNLVSLPLDEWMEKIILRKNAVKLRYEVLRKIEAEKIDIIEQESEEHFLFQKSIADFRRGNFSDSIRSNSEIEQLVKRLQNTVWEQRGKIWKKDVPESPMQILKPSVILKKIMGYTYLEADTLGVYEVDGDLFEIAGLIDKSQKQVHISKRFPQETRNFTAAHELGHAILHRQTVLHRDKPIDSSVSTSRSREELEADKFATHFLMPTKGVRSIFGGLFDTQNFVINESTAVALNSGSVNALRARCQNIRGLSRFLASTEYYGGKSFNSLAKIFGVSVETMAIRLEELNLLDF